MRYIVFLAAGAILLNSGPRALAEGATEAEEEELVPEPSHRPATLAGEVHASAIFPVADGPLCPDEAACILGRGGGVGAAVERRYPSGYGVALAYDAWFFDSRSIFETLTLQALHAQFRLRFLPHHNLHPVVGVGVGALVLGESFLVSAGGVLAMGRGGLELELTETIAMSFFLRGAVFYSSAFRASDGVRRGDGKGVNAAISLDLGLVILEGR